MAFIFNVLTSTPMCSRVDITRYHLFTCLLKEGRYDAFFMSNYVIWHVHTFFCVQGKRIGFFIVPSVLTYLLNRLTLLKS